MIKKLAAKFAAFIRRHEAGIYQLRNFRAHARALILGSWVTVHNWFQPGDVVRMQGRVYVKVKRVAPKWWQNAEIDLGLVGERVVTTAGVNYMRDDFNAAAGSADISNFKFHGHGTTNTAEAVGDTALGTEVDTRATGSQSGATSKTYITIGTITAGAGRAIVEHGIFSAVSSGTLWDRTVFSVINLLTGDSIQFTYTLTINDGG